ncbi:hypothetical protein EMCRGX_G002128 [Ephydatia muelleri]
MCHPKTGPLRKTRHPGGRSKANSIIGYINGIAPPNCLPDAPLASQLNTVMEQLLCSVCLDVLCQPLELPCRALVCTMCTVQLFRTFNCNDVKCPCCYSETPVIPSELKPAPPLVQALLSNVMVHCITCTRDMRAYGSQVLTRLADTSPDKIFSMPTKGTPKTFMQITKPRIPTHSASARTVKRRSMEMHLARDAISMGESSALLRRELDYLDEAEKQNLLQQAGIVCKIGPQDALAIKADLGVPWAKLRYLRRWLKASGVAISCEESMRDIAREVIGDNLNGEMAPFSFPAYDGGEESTTSSFTDYCIKLQKLQLMKAECAEAQDSLQGLEEVTTYVAICLGEKDPISADYIKQVKEKRQSVKAMESEINHATKVVEKGFKIQDGPFCAGLDNALQSFNVKRQQYFGGVFVGNHIHKTLMVNKLCMYSWL